MTTGRTQRITRVDLVQGRIRIPIKEKAPFPGTKARVELTIRGVTFPDVAWDPRLGPDRERSGVLYVGAGLRQLVQADERLDVVMTRPSRISMG